MSGIHLGPPPSPGSHSAEAALASEELERLAGLMRRPRESMPAFARLAPEQLVFLREAVGRACERQRRELDDALSLALPGPLRRLVLRLLRGREI